ncbi:MAG: MgtC/SapB family protein [Cyanobacteria bacterium P01_H01_bin.74]
MDVSVNEQIIRLLLAVLLGSVVGLEREFGQQYAGLRTHILVCLGATVFTLISISDMGAGPSFIAQGDAAYQLARDPGRIAAQVVTGIGFIGGGAVLRNGSSIRGLTTAASLWLMASVGMLIGVGSYQLAVLTTLLSFLVLFFIGMLEHSVFNKHQKKHSRFVIQLTIDASSNDMFQAWVEEHFSNQVLDVKMTKNNQEKTLGYHYIMNTRGSQKEVNAVINSLNQLQGIHNSTVKIHSE